jgi:tRNA G18 (ribose-2'-O)-methylase SpoU
VKIVPVQSLDNKELAPYRTLRRPKEHYDLGIFVAEGGKVVERLLESGIEVVSILTTAEWLGRLESRHKKALEGLQIFLAEKEILNTIVGYNLHQGIMAIGKMPKNPPFEETISKLKPPFLLLAMDGLVNAENVGVVVRNAAAFGVDAILVGETSSSPYLRRAVRNSMGAVFTQAILHVEKLEESLQILHQRFGVTVIAADPSGGTALHEANLSGNVCIVLGNEGDGISANILSLCQHRVAIPMMNGTDSLNVASASAVVLYEARKQRNGSVR